MGNNKREMKIMCSFLSDIKESREVQCLISSIALTSYAHFLPLELFQVHQFLDKCNKQGCASLPCAGKPLQLIGSFKNSSFTTPPL